jgi:aminodeoxyfutalosine deaminase
LADFPGHLGVEAGEATVDAVLDAGLDSVIGSSVGGIEVERGQFAGIFGKATAAGPHSVPHAGETHGADRVWSAVRELSAERIGHGIRCLDDDVLVAHLRDTRLPLEVCPTSNRCTGKVTARQPHPLPALLDAGLIVTLNSDHPAMFGTTLIEEYRQAHRMGLGADDLIQLARNGVHARFLPESAKAELLTEIDTLVR